MRSRRAVLTAVVLVSSAGCLPAMAQEQRFKLGGGAGFSFPKDPVFELQRGYDLGGFLGVRFTDNLSLEAGFSFARSERPYTAENLPVEDPATQIAVLQLQSTRYHLDGVLLYNLGRRQPFHPFVFGGAGVMREDKKSTDLTPLLEAPDPQNVQLETTKAVSYRPVASVGTGFDFYIFYNLSARMEARMWIPSRFDQRTWRLFFAATFFY